MRITLQILNTWWAPNTVCGGIFTLTIQRLYPSDKSLQINNFIFYTLIGELLSLAAGTHNYTFSCVIPGNCPSSFEGAHGHVRYEVKVNFEMERSNRHRSVAKCFKVRNMGDLMTDSGMLMVSF